MSLALDRSHVVLEVSWSRLGTDTAFSWWILAFIAENIGEDPIIL